MLQKSVLGFSAKLGSRALFLVSHFGIKSFSSISTWNSKTKVIITNPVLLILESCTTMLQLKQIQAHMTRTGLITHIFPVSRVLAFCALADTGDICYARLLFRQIQEPNTYMWNTMIRGHFKARYSTFGFSFFHQMLRERIVMDYLTFVFTLKVCELLKNVFEAECLHCLIRKMGFEYELTVRNGLIHCYGNHGCLSFARDLFDESSLKDVVSWTTMIDGYASHNYSDEATRLFNAMLYSDVEPNEVTFVAVLSACSQKGDLSIGKSIHEFIRKKNVNCSLSLQNAMLDMYVKCGSLDDARDIFEKMEVRDVYSWTSMVNGYAKGGDLDSARKLFDQTPDKNAVSWSAMVTGYSQNNQPMEALKLFHQMLGAGVVPVEHTLVSALSACGQLSCLEMGQWMHQHFISEKRIDLNATLANALVDMYAKCGNINAAAEVFNEMPTRNLVSWNSMIAGYASHGHAKQALILFEKMIDLGYEPDAITFVGLLSACCHGGLVSEGREYFKVMEKCFGIEPKAEHYACMIDLLGRTGHLEGAYQLITNMPMEPNEAAWGALLNSSRMHKNVELAKLAANKLLSLDPEDSGIYVLLANACADVRNWEDVKMLRRLMRDRAVKKVPGHSLIEVNGAFAEFLMADESHPQSKEIYELLKEIYLLSNVEARVNNIPSLNLNLYHDNFETE